ncbi:MAG: molybdopterin cofactor-binding domain-containing protein [Pseudomonadota bacterium]|nr:molybdopterin cofactor-binding domain-containing protein [Pseudomonadota bacterium]
MPRNPSLENSPNLDDWIIFAGGNRVTVRSGKVDIGQHVSTAIATIAAEELNVDPACIDVPIAVTGIAPNEGITSGSMSMETSGEAVRKAAATAHRHLLSLAAGVLEADEGDLEVEDGLVRVADTNKIVSYWELMQDKEFGIEVDEDIALKSPSRFKYMGKKTVAKEMRAIVTGAHTFVHDMTWPNMLHARLVRPPHYWAKLKSIKDNAGKRLAEQGITLVVNGSFIAVAGEDEWSVVKAAERLKGEIIWDRGEGLASEDLFDSLVANKRLSFPVVDGIPREESVPPLAAPPTGAALTLTAQFERPYTMHGSIAPSSAAAIYLDDKLTAWTHSQGIYLLRISMADALEMEPDDVTLHHALGSGCYGHNGADDVALDAALIARKIPGHHVLVKWTRDDEHAWEPYSPAMAMRLRASIGDDGKVMDWSHETYSDTHVMRPRPGANRAGAARLLAMRFVTDPLPAPVSEPAMGFHIGIHRNLDPLYDFPERRLVKNLVRDLPLRTSAMRTLGAYSNVFAIESFMDELAQAASADPVDFRLAHLSDDRARDVVEAAGKALRGGASDAPEGRGWGFGFARYKNVQSYAAVGIELEVTDAAEVKLHRAVIAADAGQVVDPDGLSAQMEGGLIQAASWTLYEEVTFDGGGITSRDWDTYPIMRFDNIPEIEVILMERPNAPFLGAGEASSGPSGAAIANAVYDATGIRLRRLPMTPENIRRTAMD